MVPDFIFVDANGKTKVALGGFSDYTFQNFSSFLLEDPECLSPNADIISNPHSNSFLDLDGDCIPDIFMQKLDSNGTPYYEIYIQKQVKNSQVQKFCLMHTNKRLLNSQEIPLVQFADLDRDGMADMFFFSQGSIYSFYNLHNSKKF